MLIPKSPCGLRAAPPCFAPPNRKAWPGSSRHLGLEPSTSRRPPSIHPAIDQACQAVADRRFVDDDLWMGRILLQLLPERAHCHSEIFRLTLLCRPPGAPQQVRMGEHSAPMLCELGEDGIFL